MAAPANRPYRRRSFFVKHWFQTGFALYPVLFLSVFLTAGAVYLHRDLRETLEFQLYLPHARLANPWDVVAPAVARVAAAGGAAFLLALGVWGWRRFQQLHRDMGLLAAWLRGVAEGGAATAPPAFREGEVRVLGAGLERAARAFEAWDRDVEDGLGALDSVLEGIDAEGEPIRAERLLLARERWRALAVVAGRVRLEEDLS